MTHSPSLSPPAAKEMHKAPAFVEKLQNTGVAEGYPVRLECRVSGVPYPQIFWKRENESFTHNTDRIRYEEKEKASLHLYSIALLASQINY